MANFDIFIENSKRLKKFFSPINPLFGDPKDTGRFLFNVNGIKKAYLPLAMKTIPLIQQLMIAGSVSKFKRSHFFKANFNSISAVHSSLNEFRLKYDLPFWIHKNYPDQINFNEFRSLFSIFNESRWIEKPLRIMVRSNLDQDTTTVINLFILWFKEYAKQNTNVMFVAPSNSDSRSNKDFFLQLKEFSDFQAFKFTKTSIACSIYQPSNKSKYWFTNVSEPDKCRSLDFSFLILHDMGQWKNSKQTPVNKIISSALPVIPESKDSAVIMHAGPLKRNSFFRDEFKVAKEALSGFTHISVPWYHNPSNIYRFDFPEDKRKFYNNLIKYRNRKSFPHYPNANVKYLYSLWLRGLPLEAIYWYASESSFYKSLAIFNNLYPSD